MARPFIHACTYFLHIRRLCYLRSMRRGVTLSLGATSSRRCEPYDQGISDALRAEPQSSLKLGVAEGEAARSERESLAGPRTGALQVCRLGALTPSAPAPSQLRSARRETTGVPGKGVFSVRFNYVRLYQAIIAARSNAIPMSRALAIRKSAFTPEYP